MEFWVGLHQQAVHEGGFAMVEVPSKSHRANQLGTVHQVSKELHVIGGLWQLLLGNLSKMTIFNSE